MKNLCARLFTVFSLLLALALLGGCVGVSFVDRRYARDVIRGEGELVSREIPVDAYTTVELHGGFRLHYSAEPRDHITLEMQENLFDYLIVEVKNDRLVIDRDRDFSVSGDKTPVLTLYNPNLAGIRVSGAVEMPAGSDTVRGDSFLLQVSGACEVDLELDVDNLDASISGAGEAVIRGRAGSAGLSISGAGNFSALELETQTATVMVSGSGDATISCAQSLDISVSGAASVGYRGSPSISQRVSGAGNIYQID